MRVGFVINSRVVSPARMLRERVLPHVLWTGWDDSGSPMSFMRFRWVAEEVARTGRADYRLYAPLCGGWDAVVFLKSMGRQCADLAERLKARGVKVIFEANVDYYTRPPEHVPAAFAEMSPTEVQRADAIEMTELADVVIASSRHLGEMCRPYARTVRWVPDNVNFRLVPPCGNRRFVRDGKLRLVWSGIAAKASEFLLIEPVLREMASRIHLHLVTDDLDKARGKWRADVREKFDAMMGAVPHTVHRFTGIADLLKFYAQGGVALSPRYLELPYNLSHTEWKISLPMACGLPVLASPVPSYVDAAKNGEDAVRICRNNEDWKAALEDSFDEAVLRGRGDVARDIVEKHYSTSVVAQMHLEAVQA